MDDAIRVRDNLLTKDNDHSMFKVLTSVAMDESLKNPNNLQVNTNRSVRVGA
jgi:hypothetical protein